MSPEVLQLCLVLVKSCFGHLESRGDSVMRNEENFSRRLFPAHPQTTSRSVSPCASRSNVKQGSSELPAVPKPHSNVFSLLVA